MKYIKGYGFTRDITERKRMEEKLRLSEDRFTIAFHSNPAAIALITVPQSVIFDVNATCLSCFGYQREEVIGKTTMDLRIWPSALKRQDLWMFAEKGMVRHREELFCKKIRGEQFPVIFLSIQ